MMPVEKLRHISEANGPRIEQTGAAGLRAAFEVSEFCRRLRPWVTPRGVKRFRSLDEAHER